MPQGRTGVTAQSANRLVFDAGEVYVDIDITALEATGLEDALDGATKLGATNGGSVFTIGRTLRQIPVDGQLGPTRGFVRRENVAPTLTVNLLEITIENLVRAIAGLETDTVTSGGTRVSGGAITDGAYLDNVALITTFSGTPADGPEPIILVLHNVMANEAPTFNLQNRNELVLPVTFNAHIDPDDPYTEPWAIYHPQAYTPPA